METTIFFKQEATTTPLDCIADFKHLVLLCFTAFTLSLQATPTQYIPIEPLLHYANIGLKESHQQRALLDRLIELAQLSEGWERTGSMPMHPEVQKHGKEVLQYLSEEEMQHITLFLRPEGNLYIDLTKGENIGGITIKDETFTYFYGTLDECKVFGEKTYSIQDIQQIIQEFNAQT